MELRPGTPEQEFCGSWFHCEACGPTGGATCVASPGLLSQLAQMINADEPSLFDAAAAEGGAG